MSKSNKPVSMKINLILNTFLQIVNIAAPLITAPYVSRILGVDQIGTFSYIYSLNYYFVMLIGLGTTVYGMLEIAKVRDNRVKRSTAFWEIELITVTSSVLCIAIWVVFSLMYQEYTNLMMVMILYLLAVVFDISWFFIGLERVKYTVTINATMKILGVVFIFLFVNDKQDLISYTAILSSSMLLGNISMWIFIPKYIKKSEISISSIMKHFKGTMLFFIPTIATSVYMVLDKTLIGFITSSATENGYYEQATKVIGLVKAITVTSFNTLIGSRMAYLYSQKNTEDINKKRDLGIEFVMCISVACCFGLIGISNVFVPVFFGNEFSDASIFLILMAPLLPIMSLSNLVGNIYYNPSGQRKKSVKYLLIGCAANIVLNLIFIPLFKGCGAVVGSIIAEALITFMYVRFSRGFISGRSLIKSAWKKVVAGMVIMIAVYLVGLLMGVRVITVLVQIFVGLVLYPLVLFVLKDSSLNMIEEIIKKRAAK